MSSTADTQLQAIRAMMASGHRSVRMERHTLIGWGLAAAALILAVPRTFTPERFAEDWQRAFASTAFIAIVLALVGIWDFRRTRHVRRNRDETISFVQLQVTKVWWLVVGLIVVINLGMQFFGGGYLFYGITLALMGLAFYVHGLFSQQMLTWIGALLLLIGLISVALRLPVTLIEWLAVFVFGLGLPVLGLLLDHIGNLGRPGRALLTMGWLVLVGLPAVGIHTWERQVATPDGPALPLATFRDQGGGDGGVSVVRLPAGTTVPVQIKWTGSLVDAEETSVPVRLARPVELVLADGEPDGRFRVGEEPWRLNRYDLRIRARDLDATLTPGAGPVVSLKISVDLNE